MIRRQGMKTKHFALLLMIAGCLMAAGCRMRRKIEISDRDNRSESIVEPTVWSNGEADVRKLEQDEENPVDLEPEDLKIAESGETPPGAAASKKRIEEIPVREADEELFGKTVELLNIERSPAEITECFLGIPWEEAQIYRPESVKTAEGVTYFEFDNKELTVTQNSISYYDYEWGLASCYEMYVDPFGINGTALAYNYRNLQSEKLPEYCTEKEVLEACAPYAKACGYSEDNVVLYAILPETILWIGEVLGNTTSAPDSSYQPILLSQIKELEAEGKKEEAFRLTEQRYKEPLERGIAWEESDAAVLAVYRQDVGGIILDNDMECLDLLFVPKYKKVIIADGFLASGIGMFQEEQKLVSKEDAVSEALLYLGEQYSKDIEIEGIRLSYFYSGIEGGRSRSERFAPLCWRIDYSRAYTEEEKKWMYLFETGTVFVDAYTGTIKDFLTEE